MRGGRSISSSQTASQAHERHKKEISRLLHKFKQQHRQRAKARLAAAASERKEGRGASSLEDLDLQLHAEQDEEVGFADDLQLTEELEQASTGFPDSVDEREAKLVRITQLFRAAEIAITKEQWSNAEADLENILEFSSDLEAAGHETAVNRQVDRAQVYNLLAYARQCAGKLELALQNYQEATDRLRSSNRLPELAAALLNYGEVLAFSGRLEDATSAATESVQLFERLEGADSEHTAAAKSNLGAYLCSAQKYEEARQPTYEALHVFAKALGRANGYTVGTLRNYYKLLEALSLHEECQQLKEEWKDASDLSFDETPKFSESSERMLQSLAENWKTPSQIFDPEGFLRPNNIDSEELEQFVEKWEREGIRVPAELAQMLREELLNAKNATSPADYAGMASMLQKHTAFPSIPDLQNPTPQDLADRLQEASSPLDVDKNKFNNIAFEMKHDEKGVPFLDPLRGLSPELQNKF